MKYWGTIFQNIFFHDTDLANSSNLSKSSFANLNLKKLWFKTCDIFVPIFYLYIIHCDHRNLSNIQQKLTKYIFGEIIDVSFERLFWKITYRDEFLVFNILLFYFSLEKVFPCSLSTWCCFLSACQHSQTLFSKSMLLYH